MKLAFCTCVQLGLSCIKSIYRINGNLDLLITLHDNKGHNKSGRIYLDEFANDRSIKIIKINHINDNDAVEAIKAHNIDWLFIIGWSQIASKETIQTPSRGVIGAHPTLLPEGRGRAAIPWAIIKGLDTTGVTIFKMDEGVDTGPILGQEEVQIEKQETATTLYDKIKKAHETAIQKLIKKLQNNEIHGIIQDETRATYWGERKPEDGQLFFDMSLDQADRLIRATTKPYPGAFIIKQNKKYIIWSGKKGIHSSASFVLDFQDGEYSVFEFNEIK